MISIEKSWPRDTISVKNTYQFVIIGGGLVGCALFHELTAVYGNQVLLIENNSEPTSIYTSGNNGYCNTAFNLPTTSLEKACVIRGNQRIKELAQDFTSKNIPSPFSYQNNGTLFVAWSKEEKIEIQKLEELYQKNGVECKRLSKKEVLEYEPFLRNEEETEEKEKRKVRSALYVADEFAVMDPHLFILYLVNRGIENGGKMLCNSDIISAAFRSDESLWRLSLTLSTTLQQPHGQPLEFIIKTKYIFNTAEMNGNLVERTLMKSSFPFYPIYHSPPPKRAQYLVFEKSSGDILNGTISTIPHSLLTSTSTPSSSPLPTSGNNNNSNDYHGPIIISKSVYGNVIAGPADISAQHHLYDNNNNSNNNNGSNNNDVSQTKDDDDDDDEENKKKKNVSNNEDGSGNNNEIVTEEEFLEEIYRVLTTLRDYQIIGSYTSLIPAIENMEGDYFVEAFEEANYIRVGGLRLNAISACLGLADHSIQLFTKSFPSPQFPKSNL